MWVSIRPGMTRRPLQVDDARVPAPASAHDVLLGADGDETAVADGDRPGLRVLPVEGRDLAVEENEIHGAILGLGGFSTKAGGQCAEAGQHSTAIWVENHDQVSFCTNDIVGKSGAASRGATSVSVSRREIPFSDAYEWLEFELSAQVDRRSSAASFGHRAGDKEVTWIPTHFVEGIDRIH